MLLANDDPFSLLVICNSLRGLNFIEKIDSANNGQEAYDLVVENEKEYAKGLKAKCYDIIFLDLNMPIKNGFEACEMINSFYKSITQNTST